MDPLNLAHCAAVAGGKAAARLLHSKKGRSKLRHYKELPNYGGMQLSGEGSDSWKGGAVW